MKTRYLLYKNSFKTTFSHFSQLIGSILLVMLMITISSLQSVVSERVIDTHTQLNQKSNLHDFIIDVDKNVRLYESEANEGSTKTEGNFADQMWVQQYFVNDLVDYFPDNTFEWTRSESRTFHATTINEQAIDLKIIAKTSLNDKGATVDKLVIEQGRGFEQSKEIVLTSNFAKANGIEIGDIIRPQPDQYGSEFLVKNSSNLSNEEKELIANAKNGMNDPNLVKFENMYWYEVVGFGISADMVMPIIDQTTAIPNIETQTVAYVSEDNFGLVKDAKDEFYMSVPKDSHLTATSSEDIEISFSGKFAHGYDSSMINELNDQFFKNAGVDRDLTWFYDVNDSNYRFAARVQMFDQVLFFYRIVSVLLILIIVAICIFTIVLISKKQIENSRKQIGCLKALGYRKREVLHNFVSVPFVSAIIGSIIGYALSFALQEPVINIFSSYFSVGFGQLQFDSFQFLINTLFIWFLFTAVSVVVAYSILKEAPLRLLMGNAARSISNIGMKIKGLYKNRKFNSKLRGALLTTSMGKIAGISGTMLLATTMLTATLVIPKTMKDNVEASFTGLNFETQVEYKQPLWNNPYTFFKTYSDGNKDWSWYVKDENGNPTEQLNIATFGGEASKIENGELPKGTNNYYTAYPTLPNCTKVDSNSVYSDLLSGNISEQMWTYGVPTWDDLLGTGSQQLGKMGYLLYKNLTSDFLKIVDKFESKVPFPVALNTLLAQWNDFNELMQDLKKATTTAQSESFDPLIETSTILRNFYKKYSEGAPLTYNSNFIENDKFKELTIKPNSIKGNDVVGMKNLFSNEFVNLESESNNWIIWKDPQINEIFDLDLNDPHDVTIEFIELENHKKVSLNNESIEQIIKLGATDKDLKEINKFLITWFYLTINDRMGVAALETAYSRAPYFLQQSIKESIINGTNYNISFNLVPYNNLNDEVGVMFNGRYLNQKNNEELLKVYGIEENFTSLDLQDSDGNNLQDILFSSQTKKENGDLEVVPIVINKTVAKKMDASLNQQFSIDVLTESLYAKDENNSEMHELELKDAKLGIGGKYTSFTSEQEKNYYSLNEKNAGWPELLGLNQRASINGKDIANGPPTEAATRTPIYNDVIAGNMIVNKDYKINSNLKFEVVGIQEGFGDAKAWIKNNDAKDIMRYDQTEEYFFNRFFVNEYLYNKDFLEFIFKYNEETGKIEETEENQKNLSKFETLTSSPSFEPKWKDDDILLPENGNPFMIFKNEMVKADGSYHQGLEKIWMVFENVYPIFNYKNSYTDEVQDLSLGVSNNQKFGDYGAIGLNGSLEYEADSETSTYYEGFGISTLNQLMPMETAREVLQEMSDLVNMVAIMLIVISLIISFTIIMLTTSIIIYENKSFIAMMKLLGYKDGQIAKTILTMYVLAILVMFVVGTLIGWFSLVAVTNTLALSTSFVLPLAYYWWLPLAVFMILFTIYSVSFGLGFKGIKKITPTQALLSDT